MTVIFFLFLFYFYLFIYLFFIFFLLLSIQVLNYQVSLTKFILRWEFSLNFKTVLNARIICILTLGQRRWTVSTQTTIYAQMHLNQYVGTTMAQR